MGLTADQILQKKRSVNLKIQKWKLSKNQAEKTEAEKKINELNLSAM